MRTPRGITGSVLAGALRSLGYAVVRQEGSHIRLTTHINGTHHVTVPNHNPLKTGTLIKGILKPVAAHHGLSVDELLRQIGL